MRAPFLALILSLTCLHFTAQTVRASLLYDFVQDGTGEVLATWELTSLPAGFEEVVGLTFTPAGDAIFGFGAVYAGEFDHYAASTARDDGAGGLSHSGLNPFGGWVFDEDNVPPTTKAADPLGPRLNLFYTDAAGQDRLRYTYTQPNGEPAEIAAYGDWRLATVPEPTSLALVAFGSLAPVCRGRRRR